jgi:hypothetical protein
MSSSPAAPAAYRRYAAHCVEIVHDLADQHRKATLLAMAQAWLALADQAGRNSQVCLVYETPTPPYPSIQPEPPLASAGTAAPRAPRAFASAKPTAERDAGGET